MRLWLHVVSHVRGVYTHTQRQWRAFWACDVWGMKTENPREWQECQTVRKRSMRITRSSWSDASCKRSSMKAWSEGWGFSWQAPDPSFKNFSKAMQTHGNIIGEFLKHRVTLTSARFSISHLLRIFMAKTLSVFLTLTTATCKKDNSVG